MRLAISIRSSLDMRLAIATVDSVPMASLYRSACFSFLMKINVCQSAGITSLHICAVIRAIVEFLKNRLS